MHDGFDYWVADVDGQRTALGAALEQANAAATPTARLTQVEAAYWTDVGTKEHLRWVMPEPEDAAARRARPAARRRPRRDRPEARLVGMFRAHGLLAPVWDLRRHRCRGRSRTRPPTSREALDEALADDVAAHRRGARPPAPGWRTVRSRSAERPPGQATGASSPRRGRRE